MRTMFFEMYLLNDASKMHSTSFIRNGKEQGEGKTEREREQGKSERQSMAEKGLWRGVINLTEGQVFMRAQRRDNLRVYQDGNKAYPKNF